MAIIFVKKNDSFDCVPVALLIEWGFAVVEPVPMQPYTKEIFNVKLPILTGGLKKTSLYGEFVIERLTYLPL